MEYDRGWYSMDRLIEVPMRFDLPAATPMPERAVLDPPQITRLLEAWQAREPGADEKLLAAVYGEMRKVAKRYLDGERQGHTLQPTALVHEAYLKLAGQRHLEWQSRSHFFAVLAMTMRQILVDHARSHLYAKRGGGRPRISLDEIPEPAWEPAAEVIAVHEALAKFAAIDPDKAALVELRFFGGLTIAETADVLGCSIAAVNRRWRLAKAWLHAACSGGAPAAEPEPADDQDPANAE